MKKLEELMNKMNQIDYGFYLNNENIYSSSDEKRDNDFSKKYFLQSPNQLLETKLGVCWDQVELERYYFEKYNIKFKSFFIIEYDGVEYPTHTFMIVLMNNKYYWFEHSWEPYRGIHEYNSLDSALCDIKNKFIKMLLNRIIGINEIVLYEYEKPKYNISSEEFFKHCEKGRKINI